MDEIICGIYCIENLVNGKKYIGQTTNFIHRIRSHKSTIKLGKANPYLMASIAKYGFENFSFYIIRECSRDELDSLEIYYIRKFKTTNRSFGYNLLPGGNKPPTWEGKKHSEATKSKMSKASMGNTVWLGRIHSNSTKEKMSRAGRGLKKKNQSSKYIGVSWTPRNSKWACSISYKGKPRWIGYFMEEVDAAKAYDEKAKELYGKDAKLNFVCDNA